MYGSAGVLLGTQIAAVSVDALPTHPPPAPARQRLHFPATAGPRNALPFAPTARTALTASESRMAISCPSPGPSKDA